MKVSHTAIIWRCWWKLPNATHRPPVVLHLSRFDDNTCSSRVTMLWYLCYQLPNVTDNTDVAQGQIAKEVNISLCTLRNVYNVEILLAHLMSRLGIYVISAWRCTFSSCLELTTALWKFLLISIGCLKCIIVLFFFTFRAWLDKKFCHKSSKNN